MRLQRLSVYESGGKSGTISARRRHIIPVNFVAGVGLLKPAGEVLSYSLASFGDGKLSLGWLSRHKFLTNLKLLNSKNRFV